jgi:hypothetical protein
MARLAIGYTATAGMKPTTPTIGTATAGNAQASVAFTASSYIGKGTISYTVTSSPGSFTASGSSSPLTVTGLSNGTAYTFTVIGTTNYGVASATSSASNSVTPTVPACTSCTYAYTTVNGANCGTCGIIPCGSNSWPAYDTYWYTGSPSGCSGCNPVNGSWYCAANGGYTCGVPPC